MKINLENYGLNQNIINEFENYQEKNEQTYFIGRIITEYKSLYKAITEAGEVLTEIKGSIQYEALGTGDFPAVGDWVILDRASDDTGHAIIHKILTRKSKLSRKMAGNTYDEQVMAANIDTLFICMSLNNDFNIRRLERYTTVAYDSGANPVIILTKSDLCDDLEQRLIEVSEVAPFINAHPISSVTSEGIEEIKQYLNKGDTIAFIGSSGVGKSTLINTLLGEYHFETGDIRHDDDKGKHTTTHRELISMTTGCSLIDTPGMRELALLDDIDGVSKSFDDIETLALQCKFSDCTHTNEPGCQIRTAIENGTLDLKRYESYQKLLREAEYAKRKQSVKSQREYARSFSKMVKNATKNRP